MLSLRMLKKGGDVENHGSLRGHLRIQNEGEGSRKAFHYLFKETSW